MIKKKYQKPTMMVVLLCQQNNLLSGSNPKELSGEKDEGGDEHYYDLG